MSTSDPDRPADDTTTPVERSTPPAETVPTTADAPATQPAPATEPAAAEPAATAPAAAETAATESAPPVVGTTEEPVAAAPVVAEPAVVERPAGTEPVSLDTGRHAVVRPAPVPPDDPTADPGVATAAQPVTASSTQPFAATEVTPAATPVDPTPAAVAAASAASAASEPVTPAAQPVTSYAAITPEPEDDGRLFPDPNAPSSPSAGSRILGMLVGLILTPIAVAVLLLGESQILEAQVDGWDATTSVFGIVLVTLGLLLLGCVLLLGIWTAAVPITGGVVLTAAGAVYLYAPSFAREQTLTVLTSQGWETTILQVTVSATSGMVLATGFLLLLAGLVISSARKRGVHLGEFRERHRA